MGCIRIDMGHTRNGAVRCVWDLVPTNVNISANGFFEAPYPDVYRVIGYMT